MNRRVGLVGCLSLTLVLFLYVLTHWTPVASQPGSATGPSTHLISVTSDGKHLGGYSGDASISADGRYVAFGSEAWLVEPDTNGRRDIFVHDISQGTTERISLANDGSEASGGHSYSPRISANGRYVAFRSEAVNLVVGDSNNVSDIFVRDRLNNTTERISVASDGTQANNVSSIPSISADGRYVAYWSGASNLVPGDTNNYSDIFVHDRQTGKTERVSIAGDGTQGNNWSNFPGISADGRFVAFQSYANNLVTDDTNDERDIFVHDRLTGATELVSLASDGSGANGSSYEPFISADGRFVIFSSGASNLVPNDMNGAADVFLHDRSTSKTELLSIASDGTQGNDGSYGVFISAYGRFVIFNSSASNLVPNDTNGFDDVFLRDRNTGKTELVSVSSIGELGNADSYEGWMSATGRYTVFSSKASNLVPSDFFFNQDVFLRDRGPVLPIIDPSVYLPAILKQ